MQGILDFKGYLPRSLHFLRLFAILLVGLRFPYGQGRHPMRKPAKGIDSVSPLDFGILSGLTRDFAS